MKDPIEPLQNGVRFPIEKDKEQDDQDGKHRPDQKPPPGRERNDGDRIARRKNGKYTGDKDDAEKQPDGHGRKSRDKTQHVIGEDGQQKHGGQEEFIFSADFQKPFVERFASDDPGDDAIPCIPTDQERNDRAEHNADEAVHAPEEGSEKRTACDDRHGTRYGKQDDLGKLKQNEEHRHPASRAFEVIFQAVFVANDFDKARFKERIRDRGGKYEQNIGDDAKTIDDLLPERICDQVDGQKNGVDDGSARQDEQIQHIAPPLPKGCHCKHKQCLKKRRSQDKTNHMNCRALTGTLLLFFHK